MRRRSAALLVFVVVASPSRARAQTSPAAAPPAEVVVRGARQAPDPAAVTIAGREGKHVAGTQGDPVKVVEDLPGVARPSFGSGQLIVWGSSPADTRIYVDGVPIPALFHGAALRSTIGGDLVRDVTLTPGAYGASDGGGLGGILRVDTRDLPPTGIHGFAAADTLDGSAMASAALGDRARVAASVRYGWVDALLKAVSRSNVDPYFAVPRYGDAQAKAEIDLRPGERLDVVLLASRDDLEEAVPDPDPSRARDETTTTAFERAYLRYRHALDDGASVDAALWIGRDVDDLDAAFGAVPAVLDESSWRGGVRSSYRSRIGGRVTLTLGFDAEGASTQVARRGSLDVPAREGDITVFGQPPGPAVGSDSWNARAAIVAPYAIASLDLGPLTLTPGLRAEGFLLTTNRSTPRVGETPAVGFSHFDGVLEPRLAARLRVDSRLSLLAAGGVYAQPPDPADLSAVFGNPTLGPATAEHVAAGESLHVTETLSAEILGFGKWMSGLAVRNSLPTPPLAEALVASGIGRSYGVQFLVRQAPWHGLSGWIAYTISRSERRDTPLSAFRLFDEDQPHVLTAVVNASFGPWTLGARFRFASGLPRTPVVGAIYDVKDDLYDPVFGAQNSIRLPDFWQIDLRVDRRFRLGEAARMLLYLEVLDATDHANAEEYVYSLDYARRATVTGLPLFAVVGARVDL